MFTAKVPLEIWIFCETRRFEQFFCQLSEELTNLEPPLEWKFQGVGSIKQKYPPCVSGYFLELQIYWNFFCQLYEQLKNITLKIVANNMKYAWRWLLENFKSTNLFLIALQKSYDCLFNCKLGRIWVSFYVNVSPPPFPAYKW